MLAARVGEEPLSRWLGEAPEAMLLDQTLIERIARSDACAGRVRGRVGALLSRESAPTASGSVSVCHILLYPALKQRERLPRRMKTREPQTKKT